MQEMQINEFIASLELTKPHPKPLKKAISDIQWILDETKNKNDIINQDISNALLLHFQFSALIDELENYRDDLPEGEEKKSLGVKIQKFKDENMPKFIKKHGQIKYKLPDIESHLPHLTWLPGSVAEFNTPKGLAYVIEEICKYERLTGKTKVCIDIQLPELSRQDQEHSKNNPDYSINKYAMKAFEGAARAGFCPEEVTFNIDGEKVLHTRFKDNIDEWTKIAKGVRQNFLKEAIQNNQAPEPDEEESLAGISGRPRQS